LALSVIGRVGWIDTSRLEQFILNCQDDKDSRIAGRLRDMLDVHHTFFSMSGLSLSGHMGRIGNWGGAQYLHCQRASFGSWACIAQVISNSDGDMGDRLGMHSILKQDKVTP
jgi:prenyltransferase beta subunit